MKLIYLDHAAATPVDASVLKAMEPYFSERFYNPSASYGIARAVARELELARRKIAHYLGARGSEITFTAGGTEANNLAIHGVMRQFPGGNIVISAVEHESVLMPAGQYEVRTLPVLPDGRINLAKLPELIDENTVLVSVMYANNEIGTIQPLRKISQLIQGIRKSRPSLPLYLHTDACQAAAYLDLHVARLGVDLLSINGGKIYGPKQSGALYVGRNVQLQPLVNGGGQERGLRAGTENVAQCVGLAAALELVQERRAEESSRLQALQRLFLTQLEDQLPQAAINGSRQYRLPNNIHLTIPEANNERLIMELEQRGILCAAGSACSASSDKSSHVLAAIGLDEAATRASLRFTMGRSTDEAAVRYTVSTLV